MIEKFVFNYQKIIRVNPCQSAAKKIIISSRNTNKELKK